MKHLIIWIFFHYLVCGCRIKTLIAFSMFGLACQLNLKVEFTILQPLFLFLLKGKRSSWN